MHDFASTNSITHESVIQANLLAEEFIIEQPLEIKDRIFSFINARLFE